MSKLYTIPEISAEIEYDEHDGRVFVWGNIVLPKGISYFVVGTLPVGHRPEKAITDIVAYPSAPSTEDPADESCALDVRVTKDGILSISLSKATTYDTTWLIDLAYDKG
jgi:hypothetical protein